MQKTESRAISIEVAGLFDKIRSQATLYGQLIEELENLTNQTVRQHEELQQEFYRLQHATDSSLKNIEQTTHESFHAIEVKSAFINTVYKELHTIDQLKESLAVVSKTMQTQKKEFEKIIKAAEPHIKRVADEAYGALEGKLALQFQQIKEEMRLFDQKLVGMLDLHRREIGLVQNDIQEFKSKVTETKYIVDETIKIAENILEDTERTIDTKLATLQNKLHKEILENAPVPPEPIDTNALQALRRENGQLQSKLTQMDRKLASLQTIMFGVAIGVVLLSAVLSILL